MKRTRIPGSATGFSAVAATLQYAWDRSRRTISLAVVYVCVALFVLVTLLDVFKLVPIGHSTAFLGISHSGVFSNLWIHQFVTAPLMHGGLTHLLFNMLSLWMLGPSVERSLGRKRYIILTLICAESSMVVALLWSWGTPMVLVGYSGVIFGILAAQALLFPNNVIVIFYFFPMKMKHAVLLLSAVALYVAMTSKSGGPASIAHLTGAIIAFVYLKGYRRVGAIRWWRALLTRLKARSNRIKRERARQKTRNETPWKL